MITHLNLLPPSQKQELKRTRTFLLIHEVVLFIFIAVALGSALLFTARALLEHKFREVVLEQVPGKTKVTKINRDIHDLNQRLLTLNQLTSKTYQWSPMLIELTEKTPANIRLLALEMDAKGIIKIRGSAKTRDDLIAFKETLEQSSYMQNIDLPLRFLIDEHDITFVIEAGLKTENMKMGYIQ